jgi:hypothetical protein
MRGREEDSHCSGCSVSCKSRSSSEHFRSYDQGKSDSLAKGLVCAQVSWMLILEAIARKVSGLPITLLELVTLVHIGCAIVMYAVWW